jgi:hypothetical protein
MTLTGKTNRHIREATQVTNEFKSPEAANRGHYEGAEHDVVSFFSAKLFISLEADDLIKLLPNEEEVGDAAPDLRGE